MNKRDLKGGISGEQVRQINRGFLKFGTCQTCVFTYVNFHT